MVNFLKKFLTPKKKSFQDYSFQQMEFNLVEEGVVQFAQWLHPGEFSHQFNPAYVDFFKRFVKKGDFVIDIGANMGDTTVTMALAAGATGSTLALEPNPHSFKILEENAKLNRDKTNIIALNFAATAEDGEFTFGSGDPSFGNGGIVGFTHNEKRNVRYTFAVKGKNLSKYLLANHTELLPKLTLIKIDTEGYDKEVLKSIPEIIEQYRPYLIVEYFGPSLKSEKYELFDLLTSKGYKQFNIYDFDLAAKVRFGREDINPKKTYNILAVPAEKEGVN
jgi:FkbM family methyltransferase